MEKVGSAVSSYIDDIIVNETEVTVEEVVAHLRKFGLIAKLPESMDGGAALGLVIVFVSRYIIKAIDNNEACFSF